MIAGHNQGVPVQAQWTGDDLRERLALLPIVQRDVEDGRLRSGQRKCELGCKNTHLSFT